MIRTRTSPRTIDRLVAMQVALMRIEDGELVSVAARLLPDACRERKRPRQNPRAAWSGRMERRVRR